MEPDAYMAVTITTENVLIGANKNVVEWNLSITNGAMLTMGTNSTLELTEENL